MIITHSDLGTQALKGLLRICWVWNKSQEPAGITLFPSTLTLQLHFVRQQAGTVVGKISSSQTSFRVWSHASPISCVTFNILKAHFRAMTNSQEGGISHSNFTVVKKM